MAGLPLAFFVRVALVVPPAMAHVVPPSSSRKPLREAANRAPTKPGAANPGAANPGGGARGGGLARSPVIADHFFHTSDGVRLHYLQAGPPTGHTLVLIPGWTMPGWIFMPQIQAFSRQYRVIAFDPRGQGESAVPATGYTPERRGRDVAELLAHIGGPPVVVVGWSLGVLDTLAAIHVAGDRHIAGLVLIDNSVGENPPPVYHPGPPRRGPPPSHAAVMRAFVRGMFRSRRSPAYLRRLTQATLRTPVAASRLLLAYPVPRTYWREALYATKVPVLYAVRRRWLAQGETLLHKRPDTEVVLFTHVGHALFVDDAARFDKVMAQFLRHDIWR